VRTQNLSVFCQIRTHAKDNRTGHMLGHAPLDTHVRRQNLSLPSRTHNARTCDRTCTRKLTHTITHTHTHARTHTHTHTHTHTRTHARTHTHTHTHTHAHTHTHLHLGREVRRDLACPPPPESADLTPQDLLGGSAHARARARIALLSSRVQCASVRASGRARTHAGAHSRLPGIFCGAQ